jgi:hypothetical protein
LREQSAGSNSLERSAEMRKRAVETDLAASHRRLDEICKEMSRIDLRYTLNGSRQIFMTDKEKAAYAADARKAFSEHEDLKRQADELTKNLSLAESVKSTCLSN